MDKKRKRTKKQIDKAAREMILALIWQESVSPTNLILSFLEHASEEDSDRVCEEMERVRLMLSKRWQKAISE